MQSVLELLPEEQPMTLQVAMVASDGLVLASDRKKQVFDAGPLQGSMTQTERIPKLLLSAKEKVVCGFAGWKTAEGFAEEMLSRLETDNSGADFRSKLDEVAKELSGTHPAPKWPLNEILVGNADIPDRVFLVSYGIENPVTVETICEKRSTTGNRTLARFIAEALYNPAWSIEKLQVVAALEIWYAEQMDKAAIEGLQIVVCRRGGLFRELKVQEIERLRNNCAALDAKIRNVVSARTAKPKGRR